MGYLSIKKLGTNQFCEIVLAAIKMIQKLGFFLEFLKFQAKISKKRLKKSNFDYKTYKIWFSGQQKSRKKSAKIIKIYSPFCVPAKVTKLIGLKRPPFLSPTNLIILACTQNGEIAKDIFPKKSKFPKFHQVWGLGRSRFCSQIQILREKSHSRI